MFCENCGNKTENGHKFCIMCGHTTMEENGKTNDGNFAASPVLGTEKWWIRLFRVLYIVAYVPIVVIIPLVWEENTLSCYYYSCSGSYSEAFWYSVLVLGIYLVALRLIKIAIKYVVVGEKPQWKKEFRKFF